MRIVLFGPAAPFCGGVPLFTTTLALKLRAAGHDPVIVNFQALAPLILPHSRRQFDENSVAPAGDSIQLFVPWKPSSWNATAKAIAGHHPDLILTMWWQPLFALGYHAVHRALPHDMHARWVYVIHDVVSHERFPGDALLARWVLSTANRFLVMSYGQERVLRSLIPDSQKRQVTHTPHPLYDTLPPFPGSIGEARLSLGLSAKSILLFFGFVRHYKGLDILLKGMPEVLSKNPDTQLLICGPFHEKRIRYEKLIRRLGISECVVIHDRYFSGADASRCFAAADVAILPYRKATQSGVIPMAYSAGVPVIASRIEGLDEYIADGESGLLVEPNDPLALAEAVSRFFAGGGKAAFGKGIEREPARYSWTTLIETLTNMSPHVT